MLLFLRFSNWWLTWHVLGINMTRCRFWPPLGRPRCRCFVPFLSFQTTILYQASEFWIILTSCEICLLGLYHLVVLVNLIFHTSTGMNNIDIGLQWLGTYFFQVASYKASNRKVDICWYCFHFLIIWRYRHNLLWFDKTVRSTRPWMPSSWPSNSSTWRTMEPYPKNKPSVVGCSFKSKLFVMNPFFSKPEVDSKRGW